MSERLRASRGPLREQPALRLAKLDPAQHERVEQLAERYGTRFEHSLEERTALRNYEYIDLLDRAFASGAVRMPRPAVVCDAGCASFWYAAALAAFFRPGRLVGVDVEGYRRLKGGHTRIDAVRGYLSGLGQGEFVVADYRRFDLPADVITSFFPFLTVPAILAWRLPTTLLDPSAFFAQVRRNLRPGGLFVMVNHGPDEARLAHSRCVAAGLVPVLSVDEAGVLSAYRSKPALISLWRLP